jgi:hypothetical protein
MWSLDLLLVVRYVLIALADVGDYCCITIIFFCERINYSIQILPQPQFYTITMLFFVCNV